MNRPEYLEAIENVIYLSTCAVKGEAADAERVKSMDIKQLYTAADSHMLTAITAMALEASGIKDHDFTQAKGKACRKNAALDVDKKLLFAMMEAEGIWYMPLKGAIIKDLYPRFGMRQMSDIDILFDYTQAEKVKEIMLGLGFEVEHFGFGHHDAYIKKPVSSFEMHTMLFTAEHSEIMYGYYKDVKERLIKDDGNRYGYHFSDEDFYIFMLAHEYKHYSDGGTGLRSLLDIYVYMQKFGNRLNMEYIECEVKKLGISDFERQSRHLALNLFDGCELSAEDKEMLEYIVFSGTFGTTEHSIENKIINHGDGLSGKIKYLLRRLFPPLVGIKETYPFFYKHKILLPFLTIYRFGKGLTTKRHQTKSTLIAVKNAQKKG